MVLCNQVDGFFVQHMGQKLQDGKKVLCVSLYSAHSEIPPGETADLSNLPFWILGNHYGVNTHQEFLRA